MGQQFITDPSGKTGVTVLPYGQLRVALDASPIFYEDFGSGTVDVTLKWKKQNGGTGIAPTDSVGASVLNGGTTANSFSLLQTLPTFQPQEPGYVTFAGRVNLNFPTIASNYSVWGLFSTPATPTFAAPVSNGAMFELSSTGVLNAVTYASGARLLIASLGKVQPVDANSHKYFVYFTGAQCYWAIDDPDNVVAQFLTGASGPDVNTLPASFMVVSNGGSAATMQINAVVIGNTTGGNITQCDSLFPFLSQQVTPNRSAIFKAFSSEGNDWSATSGITPLAVATSTLAKAAGAAGVRNYVTGIQAYNNSATVSTTFSILDGAAVIWTGFLPATTAALPVVDLIAILQNPLRGTAATALNVQCGTVGASVFWNVQGYIGS